MRRPCVAEYLGVDGTIGLTDVLIGQSATADAIISWQRECWTSCPPGHPAEPQLFVEVDASVLARAVLHGRG